MKLLSTIAAVLISISAFSQDYIEYENGTFTQNGEELSMEQLTVLTVLHKAGRGNVRRANRFDLMHKNPNLRVRKNTANFLLGASVGTLGFLFVEWGVIIWGTYPEPIIFSFGMGAGLCAVSYKAFSRIALSPEGYLRKRDKQFYKVADKLNEAIKASNQ